MAAIVVQPEIRGFIRLFLYVSETLGFQQYNGFAKVTDRLKTDFSDGLMFGLSVSV